MKKRLLLLTAAMMFAAGTATTVSAATPQYTGVAQAENGNWYYYNNGAVDTTYTGLASNEYGWWLVENGTVNFHYTGLYCDPIYGWWLVGGGAVCFDYNGLWNDPNCGWWLIENGMPAFGYTGLYDDETCGTWLIENGTVCFDYTGLWNDANYGWTIIGGGSYADWYTGLWNDANFGWWLVEDGNVAFDYTGITSNEFGNWYVNGGTIDWGFNGTVTSNGTSYQVTNGKAAEIVGAAEMNGLVKLSDGIWHYVVNGVIDYDFVGMVNGREHPQYYTKNGEEVKEEDFEDFVPGNGYNTVGWSDEFEKLLGSGEIIDAGNLPKGRWFYVENGEINYEFTGPTLAPSGTVWIWVTNGCYDDSFVQMFENEEYWWYFEGGVLIRWGEGGDPTYGDAWKKSSSLHYYWRDPMTGGYTENSETVGALLIEAGLWDGRWDTD